MSQFAPVRSSIRKSRRRIVRWGWLLAATFLVSAGVAGCSREEANPPWHGTEAVVSAHHEATEAGLAVLEAGGSAADAAVAVAATLSVVEPWFSSVLGGGTWALYYDASSGTVTSLDGVGPVGSGASVADYEPRATEPGIHQSIVPGAWDGWMVWLERFGRLPLREVLGPAVDVARDGYVVSGDMEQWLRRDADAIRQHAPTAAIYAPEGSLLDHGDVVRQEDLADTFDALAAEFESARSDGRAAALQATRDYVYRGPVAEAIVAASDSGGGYLTLDDFSSFSAELVEPISIPYGDDVRVYQNPPNSQGITQLMALRILDGLDLGALDAGSAETVHLQAEALKLAFAVRNRYVGDPARVDVPVDRLLSAEHAAEQRDRIQPNTALEWPFPTASPGALRPARTVPPFDQPTGTTTFHVVDGDGNAAAVTTSLGAQFRVIGDTGVHINNRMRFLAMDEDDPNHLSPGYKVRHTSNPYMALRDGRPYILGGNTGVDTQPQGQLQQFVNVVHYGFTAQQAIDAPRFVSTAFPSSTYPYQAGNTLDVEFGFGTAVIDDLEARGHDVRRGTGLFGVANMLTLGPGGIRVGVDDGRYPTASGNVRSAR